ncbi:MAG: amino acid permease [Candidatus Sericytochromatia bacterium]
MNLLRRKPLDQMVGELGDEHHSMNRVLGPMGLIFLGLGSIIGAGIFSITGQAAAQYAGPGITLSFILAGIACALAALCYAEFASAIPVAGSAYSYSYASMGEFWAWMIGWDLMLEYLFAAATVAVSWSGYVSSFLKDFGIVIPTALSSPPIAQTAERGLHLTGSLINLPAVLVVLFCGALLYRGISESTRVNNVIVVIKMLVLLALILFGAAHIDFGNWVPFVPPNTGTFGEFGWTGVARGAAVVFFAYIGFDAVSTAAQEARNPQRDMPIGIIGALLISTVVYILVALVITGIVPYPQLNVPDPVAVAVNQAGPSLFWLRPLIKIGAIAGLSSVILVSLLGQTRVFFSMSRDGLLPPIFGKLHPKLRTPATTTVLTTLATLVVAGLLPINILGELVSIGTLLAFALVCGSIPLLRRQAPDLPRPFKVPGPAWLLPGLGVIAAVGQTLFLPWDTWLRLLVWMAIGMVIYFTYGYTHSRLNTSV